MIVEITLDGAPRGKERVKTARLGHKYTPERTVSWESRMALQAQNVMAGRPLLEGPLRLTVRAHLPVPASWPKKRRAAALNGETWPTVKPDWDNIGKLLDALNMIVWVDDAQIADGRVLKHYSDRPRTVVTIETMAPGKPYSGIFT